MRPQSLNAVEVRPVGLVEDQVQVELRGGTTEVLEDGVGTVGAHIVEEDGHLSSVPLRVVELPQELPEVASVKAAVLRGVLARQGQHAVLCRNRAANCYSRPRMYSGVGKEGSA